MAARMKIRHDENTRAKIKTSQLVNRLTDHALADHEILTASQVRAIEVLLKKTLPDLASVENTGTQDVRHTFTWQPSNSTTDRENSSSDSMNGDSASDASSHIGEPGKPSPACTISNGQRFNVKWKDPDSPT